MMMRMVVVMMTVMVIGLPVGAGADERPVHENPRMVTIRLSDYAYEPNRLELTRGEPVVLRLVNEGKILHEFVTDAFLDARVDVEGGGVISVAKGLEELEIEAGTTAVLRFTPNASGQFTIRCDAETPVSHYDEGMTATLLVR